MVLYFFRIRCPNCASREGEAREADKLLEGLGDFGNLASGVAQPDAQTGSQSTAGLCGCLGEAEVRKSLSRGENEGRNVSENKGAFRIHNPVASRYLTIFPYP
jgi:hypothetical protein